jgi:periodic tryptophan protein 1
MEEGDTGANYAISAVCWVPRGAFSLQPRRTAQPTEEEIKKMTEEEGVIHPQDDGMGDEEADVDVTQENDVDEDGDEEFDEQKVDEELAEFNFKDYDDNTEEEYNFTNEYFKSLGGDNLRAFQNNAEDPYLKDYDTDSSEERDLEMQDTDIQILSIQNEEDATTTLQVYVYEEDERNLFLHHDILLQTYGLCVEWMNFDKMSETPGNFCAVGTFDPFIEIWDIDVIDALEPVLVLGDPNNGGKKKKKKQMKKEVANGTGPHTGAILGLAWHKQHKNILASSSDDNTVKIWDLNTAGVKMTLNHHNEPVQSVRWHFKEANILLTGSFDKRCCVMDSTSKSLIDFHVSSGIESLSWNPHALNQFIVSTEEGKIFCFDIRNNKKALLEFQPHTQSCSDFSINPKVPNLLATSSHDGTIKLWDFANQTLLWEKDMSCGEVYCVSFNTDHLLAVGGMKDRLKVLDVRNVDPVKPYFN